jgi:DNA-binding response OmpR family regulator
MKMPWTKRNIGELTGEMPRHELVRRSRILMIDDEEPEIVKDLKSHGFAFDYEPDGDAEVLGKIEKRIYDLVLLDYSDVGTAFGNEQGLSILRHIKRVSPATVVFAYTSKALESHEADFYRLSDGVLAKDAGIQESMDKIEQGLQAAHSIPNLWRGLIQTCGVTSGSNEDAALQDAYVRCLSSQSKVAKLKNRIFEIASTDESKAIATTLIVKLIELGLQARGAGP